MLWRHGRTRWNVDGRFQGQLDSDLEQAGLVDVALAAQVLAQLPPARLLTSSAGRARGSAAYLEKETGLVADVHPELQEIYLGGWQGLGRPEVIERFPEEHAAWVRGEDVRRGGGETYAEVAARSCTVLRAALESVGAGEVVVAVLHGGTARAIIGQFLELPTETWWRLAPLGNARWTVLLEGDRGFRLAEHNAGVTEPVDRSRVGAFDVEPDADEGRARSADI
ncbi:MAG: histidine phosphatase family protein [Frankiaceae bacterium]